jgi:hypothetical protein
MKVTARSCNNSACVEVELRDGVVAVTDSCAPEGPELRWPAEEWKDGRVLKFTAVEADGVIIPEKDGKSLLWSVTDRVRTLYFTEAEKRAFVTGQGNGEFALPRLREAALA